jgi:carboxyl-terminal processing protease
VTILPNDTAYVELRKITANMADDLNKELTALQDKKITRLIIDLRNNTGGVFLDSLKIAELFLPEKGVLLRTLSRSDTPQNYVSSNKNPFNFTTAILVNKNTASSCEIITSALQDSKKAIVIGTHTYGKAVFDKTFTLENQYRVKFISGAMFTPLGKSWQTKGLLPDFAVDQDDTTYQALMKLTPTDRLQKDVCLLTGYKLISK